MAQPVWHPVLSRKLHRVFLSLHHDADQHLEAHEKPANLRHADRSMSLSGRYGYM